MYLQLGVDGLRGLQNFNVDDAVRPGLQERYNAYANIQCLQKWGQAHSRVGDLTVSLVIQTTYTNTSHRLTLLC